MARSESARYAFNRGLISPLALARVDLKRSALSAETQENWMPRILGSMMLRAGLGYIGATRDNLATRYIPFIFSTSDTALLELTETRLRVWIDDVVLTRPAVTSVVTNGDFDANLGSWTDSDEVGGVSAWVTGGYMGLTGNGTAAAIRDQPITVAAGSLNIEHALRILIDRGPVTLRVGSTSGGDEYVSETTLGTGEHSLAFTPTGDFYIRFMSRLARIVRVNSCNVEAVGVVTITTPWVQQSFDQVRAGPESQSGDIVYVAVEGYQQRKIERRATRSWSVVLYQPEDGPFRAANVSTATMTPSVLTGNGTLTCSRAFFRSTHVGALFRHTSTGQTRAVTVTAQNQFSSAIRITGVGADRAFTINIDAVGAGTTIRLQRSLDSDSGPWTDVTGKSWTAATAESYNDALDNQIVWYRIGCKTGDYGAGTSVCTIQSGFGSITGVGRVTGFTSSTVVDIEVIADFGAITSSDDWAEGQWSDRRGWPSSVGFYEGRLWYAGKDGIVGSQSDQFDGFNPDTQGDSGPINRTIGSGPVDTINWLLPLQRLLAGAEGAEHSVRSNAFDEPLTPTNFNIKPASTQGSAAVSAVKIDSRGVYVQRGGTRVFQLEFDPSLYDYASKNLTLFVEETFGGHVVRMAVQRQPDTRLHCVFSDGRVGVLIFDPVEEVLCWVKVTTNGAVEDVVILPGVSGQKEDRVYYQVQRALGVNGVRYLEKWALETECQGGTLNKQADSFVVFTNAPPSPTVTGLTHLISKTVVVWADGQCMRDAAGEIATFVVNGSGEITLTDLGLNFMATTGVVGIAYDADFKSAKLGQTLSKHKNVDHVAPILRNTHAQGLKMGQDFDVMDNLPLMYRGAPVDPNTVYATYDEESQTFPGKWDTDARVCLRASAPRPCNVMALIVGGQVS